MTDVLNNHIDENAGVGDASVSSVAPAIRVDSSPPLKPPIQKNGMGM